MKSIQVTKFQKSFFWIVILLVTVFSRFFELTNKPLHFDEGINGWFVMQMKTLGYYKYDPNNYHGPLYFYLLQAFEFLWGRSIETLRSLPAVFSVFSVMLFSFSVLRSKTLRYAMMVFLLFSPAFIFYGRSGIHEMPFVFFQLLFAVGILRWYEESDSTALGFLLVSLVGMMTLKETFVLTLASWGVGLVFLGIPQLKKFLCWKKIKAAWSGRLTYMVLMLALAFVLLFTGFFRNPAGLVDFVRAFLPWMKTGVGETGHNKEFLYWTKVVFEAEPLVIIGIVMAFIGLCVRDARIRMVSAFSLFQFLVYSLIPYKTVWCVLSLVWGFYFVLALFVEKFLANKNWKLWTLTAVMAVAWVFGIRSAWLSAYREPIDLEHPYVYVNSTYELKNMYTMIVSLTKTHPELLKQPIQLGTKEQWPWPWLMRSYKDTRYDLCGTSVVKDAWIYFCDPQDANSVDEHLTAPYMKARIQLRQARETSLVYLRKNLFDGVYKGQYEVVGPAEESGK